MTLFLYFMDNAFVAYSREPGTFQYTIWVNIFIFHRLKCLHLQSRKYTTSFSNSALLVCFHLKTVIPIYLQPQSEQEYATCPCFRDPNVLLLRASLPVL